MMNNRGLSLIELIVAMIIIGILLAIAIVSGSVWMNQYRLEGQTKELHTDLMNVRVQAMQRNRMFFVVMTATRYTIYEDTSPAPDGDGVLQTAADTLILQKNLTANFTLTVPAAAVNWIRFDPRGLTFVDPGPFGAQQILSVGAGARAAYNCIVLAQTRIAMGSLNGANCDIQ